MPSLDDYAPPSSLWLTIAAVLARAPDGLSVTKCAADVSRLSQGRHVRASAVSATMRKMRDDGFLKARAVGTGRMPALVHTLTPVGRELFFEAREQVLALLDTTTTKRKA